MCKILSSQCTKNSFLQWHQQIQGLRQSAAANTKADFAHSTMARNSLAAMLWTYGTETNELLDFVRKMPTDKFMELMLQLGLYERLRGENTGEGGGAQLTVV